MSRRIIDNVLRQPELPKRFCKVVAPLGGGRYRVKDAVGRIFDVDGDLQATWQPGDGVAVSSGRIVGRAARFVQPKEYTI